MASTARPHITPASGVAAPLPTLSTERVSEPEAAMPPHKPEPRLAIRVRTPPGSCGSARQRARRATCRRGRLEHAEERDRQRCARETVDAGEVDVWHGRSPVVASTAGATRPGIRAVRRAAESPRHHEREGDSGQRGSETTPREVNERRHSAQREGRPVDRTDVRRDTAQHAEQRGRIGPPRCRGDCAPGLATIRTHAAAM